MLLHLEIVEHWERKGLPSPPLNPFLHLHMVEHWERKGIPPPSLLDPFLQLTKQPACETELSMVTLGPLQTRDLVSDTEKVLPVFQVHQVQVVLYNLALSQLQA